MWSFTSPFWETVFRVSTILALVCGGVGIVSAFVSAWVGYEITDAVQKDADARLRDADRKIADVNLAIAGANERAAQAVQRAAEATLKLAQITTVRHLSDEQANDLKKALERGPKGKVVIKGRWPDEEALSMARQMQTIFADSGFTLVETEQAQKVLSLGNIGINIIVRDINNVSATAAAVHKALLMVGIEASGISMPAEVPQDDLFWIMVGSRY